MTVESRPGPRSGKPLSDMKWVAAPQAIFRTHEGSLNERIVTRFQKPRVLSSVLDELVQEWEEEGRPNPPSIVSLRDYLQGRIYELKRRDLLIVKGLS